MDEVVMAFGPCIVCSRPFFFNPHAVPSIRIDGVRQPICESCMAQVNSRRAAAGRPPLEVLPDAYAPLPAENL